LNIDNFNRQAFSDSIQTIMASRPHSGAKDLRRFAFRVLVFTILMLPAAEDFDLANAPQDTPRTIVSEDFTKYRPKGRIKRNSPRKSTKAPSGEPSGGRSYRLATQSSTAPPDEKRFSTAFQLGLTMWKLRRSNVANFPGQPAAWIAERVEADTEFHDGDLLRFSIESPRAGYLYVIDRDWFTNGDLGETSLIFPVQGDDNRLVAGRLIDIPAQDQAPFRATPKLNQAGEILTIIVTSAPLKLPLSHRPLPISTNQLIEWEEKWGATVERFELQDGAGRVRTRQEQQAASRTGTRQLTRDDPAPQTIYLLAPRNNAAFLFNLKISYTR
jgi:hypothetical protein